MAVEDYSLCSTDDLVDELRKKHSGAYVMIFVKRDEDIGPNSSQTVINCFESAKMQMVGLVTRLFNIVKSRSNNKIDKVDKTTNKENDTEILNKDGKEIIEALSRRTEAGAIAIIFNDFEVYTLNWESTKGQSAGLSLELYEKIAN